MLMSQRIYIPIPSMSDQAITCAKWVNSEDSESMRAGLSKFSLFALKNLGNLVKKLDTDQLA